MRLCFCSESDLIKLINLWLHESDAPCIASVTLYDCVSTDSLAARDALFI